MQNQKVRWPSAMTGGDLLVILPHSSRWAQRTSVLSSDSLGGGGKGGSCQGRGSSWGIQPGRVWPTGSGGRV